MDKRYIYDNRHIAEGDIFYSSWGYDQTNIDFYMVKKRIGKGTAEVVPLENKIVHEQSTQTTDAVVPYHKEGKPFKCRIKYVYWDNFKQPRIKLSSYQTAHLWDGNPKHQTNAYYGR